MYQILVKPAGATEWSARDLDADVSPRDREAVIAQARRMLATTTVFAGIIRMADGSAGKAAQVRVIDAHHREVWPNPA
jgi:hypothetical protein